MNIEELKAWFQERPVWLQEAAKRIIEKRELKAEDYEELYEYCLNEAKEQNGELNVDIPINQLLNYGQSDSVIRLNSIGDIKGINALVPKKPLNFGEENLSIVYGLNRSGKSGYVRILKCICGAKSCLPLFSNVYKSSPEPEKKCTIEYKTGNELKKKEWNASEKPIDDLICVDIFDSVCAMSYVTDENEISYEPKVLLFFSSLAKVCEKIFSKIKAEIEKNPSKKPHSSSEYNTTKGGKWYNQELSADTTEECLNNYCSWTEINQKELSEIQNRLTQADSGKEAKKIREKNRHLRELIDSTNNLLESLSDQKCIEVNGLKEAYNQAKQAAKVAADQAFENAPLKGVGSETWKQLWQYAREYSEKEAYKEQPFPVISDDALCVLCHQKLDKEARTRFVSFKDFVKGEAQKSVENTKKSLEDIIKGLPNISDQRILQTKLDATGIQLDNTQFITLYVELEKRKNQLISSDILSNLIPLPSFKEWKSEAEKIIIDNEQKAKQYDEDAKGVNREELLSKQKELKMSEWLSQQFDSIKEEIKRLQYTKVLNLAKRLTNTTAISNKKSELSKKLITEDFVKRFNTELKKLKAEKIKVKISKPRTERGKVYHQIQLKNTNSQNVKTGDILSEGEFRIVALSTFLADVTGGEPSAPFVFDDPISSLDQDFEEAVAHRLVQLSKGRQVIVFTHRLSMLGLLEEHAKKDDVKYNILCVKEQPWSFGEPGDTPLFVKKPDTALNILIGQLPEAKNLLENQGREVYERSAKALVGDFREIIEKAIESVLLTDIVKRYRRQIHSQKVKDLTKINNNDCKFIDDLMTKYSSFLHSQPDETPVELPDPAQLKEDFESLKNWIKEFKKR